MNRSKFNRTLAFGLVLLLVVQMNALPIHEFNLRQQGYTLIHKQPWELGRLPDQMTFTQDGKNYYNIALCETHFQINLLKQYHEVAFLLLAYLGFFLCLSTVQVQSTNVRKDYFLASLSCRAPPVIVQ